MAGTTAVVQGPPVGHAYSVTHCQLVILVFTGLVVFGGHRGRVSSVSAALADSTSQIAGDFPGVDVLSVQPLLVKKGNT